MKEIEDKIAEEIGRLRFIENEFAGKPEAAHASRKIKKLSAAFGCLQETRDERVEAAINEESRHGDDKFCEARKMAHKINHEIANAIQFLEFDESDEMGGKITDLVMDIVPNRHRSAVRKHVAVFCRNLTGDVVDGVCGMRAYTELIEGLSNDERKDA